MKCRLTREMKHEAGHMLPVGQLIDDPRCFRLVQMGCADPADDECTAAAGMTPERTARARRAYDMLEKRILREDWDAYDAGLMVGYDTDGNWIPGPNYVAPEMDAVDQAKLELLEQLLG